MLDDRANGLLRELDDQARSNVLSYVNRVCKVVDACDIHVLLRVIIEVYTEQQQQQQPPQSRSGEELATCWVNVPGIATGYRNPPGRVVEEGDVRSTGRRGIEGCLRRVLGDRSFEWDIVAQKRGGDPDRDPRMHGWYLLRGEGGLLDAFIDKASALPDLRRWCFIPRATEPWVSLWVGNLRCATAQDVQGHFDALFPTTRVIVKMQGSCSSGSSAFVCCHGLRDALHIKSHLGGHGSSAMFTPHRPSVRFASWQLQPQPQQRQHGGSTSTKNKPRDTGQRRRGVQNDDGDDQAERTRLEERVQVLSDQNRLLGGWLSDMDEEIRQLRYRAKKRGADSAIAAITEIETLSAENRRLSASEIVPVQKIRELEYDNEQVVKTRDAFEVRNRELECTVSEMERLQTLMNADILELKAKLMRFDVVSPSGFGDIIRATCKRQRDDGVDDDRVTKFTHVSTD